MAVAIEIIKEPTVHVTEGELARYTEDYQRDHMFYAGPLETLEEYIRRRQQQDKDGNGGWRKSVHS
jgi:SH3-like domain-containing protein